MGDLRLAVPAAVAWIVLAVLVGFPDRLSAAAVLLWILAGVTAVALLIAGPQQFRLRGLGASRLRRALGVMAGSVVLASAAAALVLSAAALAAPARMPQVLVRAAQSHRSITATAVTDAVFHPGSARTPLSITLTSVTVGQVRSSSRVPVLLFGAPDAPDGSGIGTGLVLAGTIAAAEPGDSVAFLVFARGSPRVIGHPPWYLDWANALRSGFVGASRSLPGDGGDLLPGLAIGDTSAVNVTLDAAMKSTSLSHLTAVSGANCAVIIGLVMIAGAAAGIPRHWRVGGALVVLVGFVALVTPQASVLRAAVMAALVLAAMAGGRSLRGIPVLSLAVIILLTIDPWLCRNYGFLLSVLATAGLLLLVRPLTALLGRGMPRPLAAVIAIPLAAQIACQPVLILLNPAIPVYGVVANLLSEPAAPLATVLGLAACLLIPIAPPLGHAVAAAAWLPSTWIAAVARFFTALPGSQARWLPGAVGVALAAMVIALVLFAMLAGDRWPRARRGAAALLVLVLVVYTGGVVGDQVVRQLARPANWEIAACDIGQGDAVLVRSAGQVALVDTGPDPRPLEKCLRELGIGRIQLLVLTHYDLDHVGGTAAVFGRVDRAMVGPVSDAHDTKLRQALAASGAHVDEVAQGEAGTLGQLNWRVLWPPARLGTVQPGNDASVTIAFHGGGGCASGCLSSLFLGDLGREPQARVLAANRIGPVDVVKVAHHGSADQNLRMYQVAHARVGIIGVGAHNDYGHPTAALLGILASVGTSAERTDRQGMILVSPAAGGTVTVWSEHSPRAPATE
ncbi:ComEC/Rec2 family competence protein [Parafrigoribacterium mesophilum]|uniref:ComEC/Rec2 family competence protein n=1 Tax=Parafrigoribacterium mesophilum TaxID=433646 RepID=UPI0031FC6403